MKKLFVTGASGFLGWNLCRFVQGEWDVYATYSSHPLTLPGVNLCKIDLTQTSALTTLIREIKPDAVIHTAAASKPNDCQTHPEASYQINVTASLHLAELCAEADIPCVFTSTDLVFDGFNPPYSETSPVCPLSIYGEQKAEAEQGMLARYPKTAVCRLPLMFGVAAPTAQSFIQPFIQTLRAEQELKLFTDEFRMPVSAKTATEGLLLALEYISGIIHLGGKERLSRYEFGCLMVEVLDLPSTGLMGCSQKEVKMAAPRPADLSLDSSKAFRLGYNPPSLRTALTELRGLI
ncbi:NAD(P)-dependent oxidoreductase [Spirulina subsalsa FACHB-351]|uniref:dTDP-4-dehydrorhamnose reductase n=1 Tax=Spirulina subsalsa FACHB-351 TaxID=234711 RepID=A0ABT3L816_9CYAN|nr:NAD(P)-dependent oxidoreductase [Spirulina subsalsa]MCW6037239.1 NAD(P)-dependent oxidoreductase [Spirulina subsalsa FACHB-351]